MNRKYLFVSILSLTFLQLSCLKNKEVSCDYSPCRYVAPASEIADLTTYLTTNSISATKHCSGLFYSISDMGTGKQPDACKGVSVKYTGRLTNGNIFDERIVTPLGLDLSSVITGWRSAIPLIKEGGRMTLYIPPYLGYGAQDRKDANGNVVIPGNSILIFTIELVSVL
jgi:FKBP-type peptidyl-prolyl cis-trans isomerase FkpA